MLVSLKSKIEEGGGGEERGEGCPNCPRPCENAVDKTSVIPIRRTSSHFPFCQLMYLQCKHLVGVNYNHKLTKVYPNNYVWFEVRVGSWGGQEYSLPHPSPYFRLSIIPLVQNYFSSQPSPTITSKMGAIIFSTKTLSNHLPKWPLLFRLPFTHNKQVYSKPDYILTS